MTKKKGEDLVRNRMMHFSVNDKEFELIIHYIKKYKIENKSRWIRETLIAQILKNLEKDHPTLFGENEMRR